MKRVIFAAAWALLALAANASDKPPPAYVPEQAQASAMAVPDPDAPKPVAVVVIVKCGRIVGIVVTDATGDVHPLDVTGVNSAKVKALIDSVPKQLSANVGCKADIDEQSSTL